MLCWCNLNLFDYNGYLVTGYGYSLNFHLPPRHWNDLLYPLGQTGSNPVVRDSPCLRIDFERSSSTIVYPSVKDFSTYAEFLEKLNDPKSKPNFNATQTYVPAQETANETEGQLLADILRRDPLAEISEQESVQIY